MQIGSLALKTLFPQAFHWFSLEKIWNFIRQSTNFATYVALMRALSRHAADTLWSWNSLRASFSLIDSLVLRMLTCNLSPVHLEKGSYPAALWRALAGSRKGHVPGDRPSPPQIPKPHERIKGVPPWLPHMNSQQIKALRFRMSLTQENFAAQIGVSLSTVQRWEANKSKPSLLAIKSIQALIEQEKAPAF